MKIRLLFVTLSAAITLAGCAKKETAAATAPSDAPTASAKAENSAATDAKSAARTIEITANDQMKFSVSAIEAKAGEQLKVVLKNVGSLPKEAMGHNWVLLKPGSDVAAFATTASTARATEFIPAALKDQVVAHTKLLGPNQSDEVTFTVPAAGEYPFLCSFPGHFALMKGTLTVK